MASQSVDDRIVTAEETDPERRSSYRMASFEETKVAKLKVGKKIIKVTIVDESAGGFLIETDKSLSVKPPNQVELFTSGGAHLLRVAWKRNVEGCTRLGLQRLFQAPSQSGSPWLVWLIAAMVIGIAFGVIASDGNLENLAKFFGG